MNWLTATLVLVILVLPAGAEERSFRLWLAPEISDSGLERYLLPRFALKTGRRAQVADRPDMVDLSLVAGPRPGAAPVMARGTTIYVMLRNGDNPAAGRFADWLSSDIGQRTIAAFVPADGAPFTPAPQETVETEIRFDGDAVLGRQVAERHCTRCHRVSISDRASIGSTPSFMALRALSDWAERMMTYFVRNPHPSFMRVEGISPRFTTANPPSIAPVVLSQREMEAVQAYVSALAPADLGAPVAAD